MKRIKVISLLVALALSLACQPLSLVSELVAAPTPVPKQVVQPASTPAPTQALPPAAAQLPTLAALATLKAILPPTPGAASAPPTPTRAAQPTSAPASVPSGWKQSKDSSGTCQVATPPSWTLGKDLDLTVKIASSQTSFIACPQGGGPGSTSPVTFTRTFHLAARDGESQVFAFPIQGGQTTDKFTLRVREN